MLYTVLRFVLRLTVLGAMYVTTLVMLMLPLYPALVILIVLVLLTWKRGYQSSGAHGTARFANSSDLKGMIE